MKILEIGRLLSKMVENYDKQQYMQSLKEASEVIKRIAGLENSEIRSYVFDDYIEAYIYTLDNARLLGKCAETLLFHDLHETPSNIVSYLRENPETETDIFEKIIQGINLQSYFDSDFWFLGTKDIIKYLENIFGNNFVANYPTLPESALLTIWDFRILQLLGLTYLKKYNIKDAEKVTEICFLSIKESVPKLDTANKDYRTYMHVFLDYLYLKTLLIDEIINNNSKPSVEIQKDIDEYRLFLQELNIKPELLNLEQQAIYEYILSVSSHELEEKVNHLKNSFELYSQTDMYNNKNIVGYQYIHQLSILENNTSEKKELLNTIRNHIQESYRLELNPSHEGISKLYLNRPYMIT